MVSSVYEELPEDDDEEYRAYLRERHDMRRAALGRSYVTPAVITMALYCLLWLPGLVANVVYLRAANQDAILARRMPQGRGCLVTLLWVACGLPALYVGYVVVKLLT